MAYAIYAMSGEIVVTNEVEETLEAARTRACQYADKYGIEIDRVDIDDYDTNAPVTCYRRNIYRWDWEVMA